ncbi:Uncharacterised protein [Mycobacteroides abscessus subsp. bolletii]|nr:Uncharacterised protein [Mycobacteroides abscessus subsp. bolletii]
MAASINIGELDSITSYPARSMVSTPGGSGQLSCISPERMPSTKSTGSPGTNPLNRFNSLLMTWSPASSHGLPTRILTAEALPVETKNSPPRRARGIIPPLLCTSTMYRTLCATTFRPVEACTENPISVVGVYAACGISILIAAAPARSMFNIISVAIRSSASTIGQIADFLTKRSVRQHRHRCDTRCATPRPRQQPEHPRKRRPQHVGRAHLPTQAACQDYETATSAPPQRGGPDHGIQSLLSAFS